ncbi:D-2-hydroxyacid dehydrogenase [Eshraghiella crossota]|uniref:D-2-hydroxyacid dehydrogenase n=1 Tax=Eshraghiella crossota TaxID=45851 RepID=UPI003AB89597
MKIVMLDKKTLGDDCDLSELQKMGDFIAYDETDKNHTIERIKDADAVFTNKVVIGKDEIDNASNLKYIGIMATGTNNIDLEYAGKRGITVTNVKGYSTKIVAQHTFALLFSVMEQIAHYDKFIKSGEYSGQSLFTNIDRPFMEISGKTWGVIGLGAIGKEVAGIAKAFGCNVIYYSTSGKNNCKDYCRVDFETFLKEADIISVHAPLTDATRGLIDENAFDKMKPTAYFINVGRGPIVNEEALKIALDEDKIAGAGIDVFDVEPLAATSPLMNIKNKDKIVMTPHIAWASVEARKRLIDMMIDNFSRFRGL